MPSTAKTSGYANCAAHRQKTAPLSTAAPVTNRTAEVFTRLAQQRRTERRRHGHGEQRTEQDRERLQDGIVAVGQKTRAAGFCAGRLGWWDAWGSALLGWMFDYEVIGDGSAGVCSAVTCAVSW